MVLCLAFLVESEFGNVGLSRGESQSTLRENSQQSSGPTANSTTMSWTPGFEPGPHCWDASALTTAPPLLPLPGGIVHHV